MAPAATASRDLRAAGLGVSDGSDDAFAGDVLDVGDGPGPFRRERDDAYAAAGGVLPAVKLIEIGRADPLTGMGAARTILGRDVGAFDVKAIHGMALGQGFAGGGEIPKAFQHFSGRSRDHGWV